MVSFFLFLQNKNELLFIRFEHYSYYASLFHSRKLSFIQYCEIGINLIGISPAGALISLSHGWGGRILDKQLTIESGFLDLLIFGDSILADKGFLIAEKVAARGAVLAIPSFIWRKSQMLAKDVDESRKIAHVHIHVERVIGRLETFKILSFQYHK